MQFIFMQDKIIIISVFQNYLLATRTYTIKNDLNIAEKNDFLLFIYIFEIPIAKTSFSLRLSFSPSDCLSVHLSLLPICC